jgi:hypothetical protein
MAVDPARDGYEEKREQWRHRSHAKGLPRTTFALLGTTECRESACAGVRPASSSRGKCSSFAGPA